jgi:DNA-binding SARP family transcriptional activator
VLDTRAGGYVVNIEGDELDVHRFERLLSDGRRELADGDAKAAAATFAEALALWRGPSLADFAYEPFAAPAIARLEELRLAAVEDRVAAELAVGSRAELIGELTELVVANPLRERLRGQLMLALYRDGRQAEALDLYRRTRETFVEQLGLEPGPALQELQRAVLRQDPALAPAKAFEVERAILVAPQADTEGLVELAETLARRPPREVILARLVPPRSAVGDEAARLNDLRRDLLEHGIAARTAIFTSAAQGEDLVRLAVEQDVDLVLLDGAHDLAADAVQDVLARAPCDVAVRIARDRPAPEGPVVVLFGGGEHDWAAIEIGAWIAGGRDSPLKLAGPAKGRERDASRTLASASLAVQRVLGIAAEPVLVAPTAGAVVAAVADAAVVVAGLPERWRRDGIGDTRTALARDARPPVLLVRRGLRPGGLAPRESLTRFTWTLGPSP